MDIWRRPLGEAKRSRPETVAPVDRRAFDAADNALRQRISPRSGDLRSRLKRQALAVRIEWSTGTNATPPPCWTGRGSFRRAMAPSEISASRQCGFIWQQAREARLFMPASRPAERSTLAAFGARRGRCCSPTRQRVRDVGNRPMTGVYIPECISDRNRQ